MFLKNVNIIAVNSRFNIIYGEPRALEPTMLFSSIQSRFVGRFGVATKWSGRGQISTVFFSFFTEVYIRILRELENPSKCSWDFGDCHKKLGWNECSLDVDSRICYIAWNTFYRKFLWRYSYFYSGKWIVNIRILWKLNLCILQHSSENNQGRHIYRLYLATLE